MLIFILTLYKLSTVHQYMKRFQLVNRSSYNTHDIHETMNKPMFSENVSLKL